MTPYVSKPIKGLKPEKNVSDLVVTCHISYLSMISLSALDIESP